MRKILIVLVVAAAFGCSGSSTNSPDVGNAGNGDEPETDVLESEVQCQSDAECDLDFPQCCAPCRFLGASDLVAIRADQHDARWKRLGCDGLCERCAADIDPNLAANCVEGRCKIVDL